jgi:hypothetical protein
MRIGVVFPQTELGGDAGAVRAYAQRAEELGFTHVLAYDHVAGADPAVRFKMPRPTRYAAVRRSGCRLLQCLTGATPARF